MLGTRRRHFVTQSDIEDKRLLARFAMPGSAALLGFMWLLPMHSAHASPASAAKAYDQGNFAAAERDYSAAAQQNPKQPVLQFNEGAAAYKAGEFPQAAQAFQASVNVSQSGNAKRLAEQEDAYYNLGNTLYREGQKTEQGNTESTIQTWTQALKAYDAALQLRTDDADAKFNRDLVNRRLAALKKQQSEQKQSNPQSQPNKGSSSQQSKSQQGQQGQQGKGQQGQGKDDSSPSKGQPQGGQPKTGQPQPAQSAGNSGKGEQTPSQQSPGTKQPDGSSPAGQKNEPSTTQGSPPRPDRGQGTTDSRGERSAQAGDEQRLPGEMSREEARELLDSVKDEERRAPGVPVARNGTSDNASNEPLKDW